MVAKHAVLLPSKAYREYEKLCRKQLALMKLERYTTNVNVCARYYLKNLAHYPDLIGLMQATADIISDEKRRVNSKMTPVREWILSDDRIIRSWDGTKIAGVDKDNPRVEIEITISDEEVFDPYVLKQREV